MAMAGYLRVQSSPVRVRSRTAPRSSRACIAIGALGVIAVGLGSALLGFQKGAWIGLGALYLALGMTILRQ
jgi:cytochrome c-type biogenesis protein